MKTKTPQEIRKTCTARTFVWKRADDGGLVSTTVGTILAIAACNIGMKITDPNEDIDHFLERHKEKLWDWALDKYGTLWAITKKELAA